MYQSDTMHIYNTGPKVTSDNLVEHYEHFAKELDLESNYLLHIGMDGPNVNLSFEKKLLTKLEEDMGATFLKLGKCSLHPVHTAFRKGITKILFDYDKFFYELRFFKKNQVLNGKVMLRCNLLQI